MAMFRFRLRRLLEQREREEGEALRVVAGLERERAEIEEQIRARQRMIDDAKHGVRLALSGGPIDAPTVRLHASESIHHAMQAQCMALRLSGVHSRLDEARRALAGAMRRRKAVELLRDRDFVRWRRERERREARELDDIGTAGWIRRREEAPLEAQP